MILKSSSAITLYFFPSSRDALSLPARGSCHSKEVSTAQQTLQNTKILGHGLNKQPDQANFLITSLQKEKGGKKEEKKVPLVSLFVSTTVISLTSQDHNL